MTDFLSLRHAIEHYVHDGDTVALEGFTHLIPDAAGHEIIRQGRRELTLVRMTPDVVYDQLIGAGCARKLIFSWGGNPGVGSLHRFRDAVENGWPAPLELEEHSHAGMAAAYAAGAANLPFGVLRGYRDTDLASRTRVARITCPFTGEELAAVPAHRPDVGIVHAQQADERGNVQLWGIVGVQKEVVLASARSLVTVEEIVPELEPRPGAIVLPSWVRDLARPRQVRRMAGRACVCDGAAVTLAETTYTADEMMTVEAARRLADGTVCFVGIGLPSLACNLARATHAPNTVLIYESGTIGAKPTVPPLSIGDGELAETADAVVSVPEMFAYWLQGGRIDVGFLGAAQIDRFGNLNSTVIGDYEHPKVRLPGSGGAQEIAAQVREVFVILRQSPRTFVERLDFLTSVGERVSTVVTDLGVLEPREGELTLT